MDIPWLNITPELENGIQIINQVDNSKFQKFLNHIKVNSSTRTKNEMFTPDEITALERVFKLDNNEVILIIKVTLYVLERLSKFIMRPSHILNDLTTVLKMDDEKAEGFINIWRDVVKIIADDYNIASFGEIEQLTEPTWQLNLALSSHLNKKEKQTAILLDMKTEHLSKKPKQKIFAELTTEELLSFSSQIDSVQLEVDAILRSQI